MLCAGCALVSCVEFGNIILCLVCVFFFKQKTAYEMRISDWSSDVCSSDLGVPAQPPFRLPPRLHPLQRLHTRARGGRGLCAGPLATANPAQQCRPDGQIGRASCRERVCQYVYIPVVAVSLKKKHITINSSTYSQRPPCHTTYKKRNH